MQKRKRIDTKLEIIQVATKMFIENGYYNTTNAKIAKEVGISVGNLNFHFPTKEDLLAVLIDELCDFQWKLMEEHVEEGKSSILALCLELTSMAAACEQNENIKELFLAAYTHLHTLEIIRRNDTEKNKKIFSEYCKDWTDIYYVEAENIVSGIEYATLMTTSDSAPIPVRISGALNAILSVYNVPREIREQKVRKVLKLDYMTIGKNILSNFIKYITEVNLDALENKTKEKSSYKKERVCK